MALKSIFDLSRKAQVKHKLIEALVKNKNVIHYGCVDDDKKLIKQKYNEGYYLHKIVTDSSNWTIGIDINKKAFNFLNKELSIENIFYGDVENPETFDVDRKLLKEADILLIPDLIEHLNNPGNMIEGISKFFKEDIKIYIFTPNPFAWYNFVATLINHEIYTEYHTMYFTTESMKVLAKRYNYAIKKITPVFLPKQRNLIIRLLDGLMNKVFTFVSPGFSDAFMYELKLKNTRKTK